jgi:hypothetical protein
MNASVKSSLPRQSNDFTPVESTFWQTTKCALTRVAVSPSQTAAPRESITIIIPSYNGWRTLPASLDALDGQQYRNFEVVIVDDCSSVPIAETLAAGERSFPMKYLRLEKNTGIGAARNAGLCCSDGDTVIFLDDDMRCPAELTCAQALRQEFTEGCLFVGFRENVASEVFFSKAADSPRLEHDWRCFVLPRAGMLDLTASQQAGVVGCSPIRLLAETRDFRDFGFGRVVGYWDLPNMIVGHSICVKRRDAVAAGGFPEQGFENWGTEDLAFGARMVSLGHYIIPAREWVSHHLLHEGRKSSRADERSSLVETFAAYQKFLEQPSPASRFPKRTIRSAGRSGQLERYTVSASP